MECRDRHQVTVVAFDGVSPFHLSVPCTVFGDNVDRIGSPRYDVTVCTESPGLVSTLSGFPIQIEHDLTATDTADTVIVPGWADPDQPATPALLQALQNAHRRGARVVGLCLGAFVLAEAGLLVGRTVSTHWVWADDFIDKYPNIKVDSGVLFVDDDDVVTSAGTAAAIDCCLHLLRRDHGAEVANRVARRMVTAPHRNGGQAQYIEQPLTSRVADDSLSDALTWALGNLSEPIGLNSMADRAIMSRRTFTRQFRKSTGTTLTNWLLTQRLALSQRLLETTDQSLELVARNAGFGSAVTMRQHFAAACSISPSAYRKQFQGPPIGTRMSTGDVAESGVS